MMQHQYWVTKKSVQRKLGSKEDECIVSSDAELDAKLELFRSVSETCIQLQRIIDLYQERLCFLAQEENALGRYLKECGKNEKNISAGQIMSATGKALAYIGHQRLTMRPPLVRLHHEVETFRGRAVSDTRVTVLEMEKVRTEYRAALSWMKSASTQLDPDTGHGLEKFRKAQSYVRTSKTRFDRYMLACLQKVDLLAAARCNMFSHALVAYQNSIATFSQKASETLTVALAKLNNVQPYEFCVVSELATPVDNEDKDKSTFFNAEYTDSKEKQKAENEQVTNSIAGSTSSDISNLLGEDFSSPQPQASSQPDESLDNKPPSAALLELSWPTDSDLLGDFMPSRLMHDGMFDLSSLDIGAPSGDKSASNFNCTTNPKPAPKISDKTGSQVSWLSLFKELDPLSNENVPNESGDRA